MDQIKIGKFIAEERKAKKYTQRELADKLSISDKTISKWERGNGFPEVSLLLPLCNELEITVNELLSGERLQAMDYKKKAEEAEHYKPLFPKSDVIGFDYKSQKPWEAKIEFSDFYDLNTKGYDSFCYTSLLVGNVSTIETYH